MTKNKLAKATEFADSLGPLNEEQEDLIKGLTDRQRNIVRMKMRGLSQKAIASVCNITPARVSQEMKAIREHFWAKGSNVNQAVVVGETVTLYEEIEQKAWEVFHGDESKKLRALDTVMTAREKHVKLLMDLGLLKRAAVEHTHGVVVSPVMEALSQEKRAEIVARVIETQPGIEPEPPEDDDDIEDAEIIDEPIE